VPQVARDQPYNESVDVFGFGVLLYEVFARDLVAASYVADNTMQVCGGEGGSCFLCYDQHCVVLSLIRPTSTTLAFPPPTPTPPS
jgi:hypothetical protein